MSSNEETKTAPDADELGALAAELPAGADQAGAAREQDDGDEGIDRAALAALSKAPPQRSDPAAGAEPPHSLRPVVAAERATHGSGVDAQAGRDRAAPGSARPLAAARWIGPLVLGFAVGVPVGGWLFSGALAGSSASDETGRGGATSGQSSPVAALAAPEAPSETIELAERPAPDPVEPAIAEPAQTAEPEPAAPTAERAPSPAANPSPRPTPPASTVPAPAVASAANPASARAPAAGPKPQPTAATGAAPKSQPQAATAPPAAAPIPATASDLRSVDTLLDQALSQRMAAPPPMVLTPDETVPLAPSREEVKRAMTVLLPAIRGCATGQSGLATIGIVVNNDGKVASADVTGAPFEGAASGRCIAGVVRRAKFPRFQQESFRVQFPFQIQ